MRRNSIRVLFGLAAAASLLAAGTVKGTGAGGTIPPGAPLARAGTFTSTAVMPSSGIVATGNAVTVILKGLQHDWSGDLIATLSYIDSQGNVVRSANLFYRIGQSGSVSDGSPAGFGAPGPTGDNYTFNSDAAGNIWTTAAGLGFADSIPGLQTDTVNGGQYFTSDAGGAKNNLSYAFAGLDVIGGSWVLTITDTSDHAAEGGTLANTGSLISWEIDIQTEPLAPSDFVMWLSSPSQSVSAGNSATYTLNVSPVNGFSGSASLSASWLPNGATAALSPNPLTLGCNATTATVTVSTPSGLMPGSYAFTITAQSGSSAHSISGVLVVTPSASQQKLLRLAGTPRAPLQRG